MKAIALLSGGLDSTLAVKLILEQGIEVMALHFTSPFCLCNRRSSRHLRANSGCRNEALEVSNKLGIEIKVMSKGDEYLEVIKNPKYGYGSNMNPCIDCRILMFKKAKSFMQDCGAAFIITGEVVGQRPMSQKKHIMELIDKESGLAGLVLRPLSAKVMPPTIPEINGWVNRERLLDITGRTRKPQMLKAKEYNINDYPCSAGGCLLTDIGFSRCLKDLLKYGELNRNEIELLKIGRHFRFSPKAKLVVARNEEENKRLLTLKVDTDYIFSPCDINGPVGLLRGSIDDDEIVLSSQIIARYSDRDGRQKVMISYFNAKIKGEIEIEPLSENILESLRV